MKICARRIIYTFSAAAMLLFCPAVSGQLPMVTGDLFVAEDSSDSLLRITPAGEVSVLASEADIIAVTGGTSAGFNLDGIATSPDGAVFFTERSSDSVMVRRPGGAIEILASEAVIASATGEGFASPEGITRGQDGFLYVADDISSSLLRVDPISGATSVFVSASTFESNTGISVLDLDAGLAPGTDDTIYISSSGDPDSLIAVSPEGVPSILSTGPGRNSIQELWTDATAGSFTMSFRDETTSPIAYDGTSGTLQSALQSLTTIGAGNVLVTGSGSESDPWLIEFTGDLANQNVAFLNVDASLLTGGSGFLFQFNDRGGFGLNSSVATAPNGDLVVGDTIADALYRVSPQGDVSLFIDELTLEEAGQTSVDLDEGDFDFDSHGNLFYAAEMRFILQFTPDLNYSVFVDEDTVTAATGAARAEFESAMEFGYRFAADFNADGVVDAADYTTWRDSYGMTGLSPYSLGDSNGDGTVDEADYAIWRQSFGASNRIASSPLQSIALPEPMSHELIVVSGILAGAFTSLRARTNSRFWPVPDGRAAD